jgi:muramoyltetrapeptide carboxypeptidase
MATIPHHYMMAAKTNPALKSGDLIDIVAPGSAADKLMIDAAVDAILSKGFKVRLPQGLQGVHPFNANEDEVRFDFLKKALKANDSKMVWCVRGGYGSNRLVPELLKMSKPKTPKIVVGYSDICTLHLLLNHHWKWKSLHGPLLENFGAKKLDPSQWDEFWNVLQGKVTESHFSLKPLNARALQKKKIKAAVTGGNLCTLQSAIGTKLKTNFDNEIVVFEDVGERGYRVDRMLEHFRQAGSFKKTKAIVFGEFVGGAEKDGQSYVTFALERFANLMNIPVLSRLEIGHGAHNRPLFFNTVSTLELGESPRLIVNSGFKK